MGWVKTEKTNKLSKLGDIDFTTTAPVDGNALVYDETNDVWVPGEGGGGTVLTETLNAGQTSVTFTDDALVSTCTKKVYVPDDFFGVVPTSITTDYANHTVTYTFPAQASNMQVKLEVT